KLVGIKVLKSLVRVAPAIATRFDAHLLHCHPGPAAPFPHSVGLAYAAFSAKFWKTIDIRNLRSSRNAFPARPATFVPSRRIRRPSLRLSPFCTPRAEHSLPRLAIRMARGEDDDKLPNSYVMRKLGFMQRLRHKLPPPNLLIAFEAA